MPKYLDKDGLEEFFDDIKDLVHGPSYSQVSSWMDAHPDVLSSAIATDVADATDNWLEEHPEAINTIQDGSISFNKLADAVHKGYVRSFETVADMQAVTNLKAGMTCHTNGFHTSGDGGAAYYTVSANGTANDMDVLALQGGLFATLVVTEPYVTPEMFGAWGDGTKDDSAAIQKALCTGLSTHFAAKTYLAKDVITKTAPNVIMKGCGTDSVIKWNITTTSGLRDYAGMISDDDMQSISYQRSGIIVIEDMTFDGNANNISSYPVTNAFGLCVFYAREGYSLKNCTFRNSHADGIQMRGLYGNVLVENCRFINIGQTQPADGTRNGITITRGFYDRGIAGSVAILNRVDVTITNCLFSVIADECVRVDGVTTFEMDGCTFENIGQHIVESGHLSDKHDYVARISNCIGSNIGQGIYTTGADGGGTWTYHGLIVIDGCVFKGMCWTGCTALFARNPIAIIIDGYQASENIDYCPNIAISNTIIESSTTQENLSESPNIHTLFGKNISIVNSIISYVYSGNTSAFITATKRLYLSGTRLITPNSVSVYSLFAGYTNTEIYLEQSYLSCGASQSLLRITASASKIVMHQCTFDFSKNYVALYNNASSLTNAKLYVTECTFIGNVNRAFDSAQSDPVVNTIYIVGNNIPSGYCAWGTFNSMTAPFYVKKDNTQYNLNS